VLKQQACYNELDGGYLDRQNTEKQRQRLIRKPKSLGVKLTIEPAAEAT